MNIDLEQFHQTFFEESFEGLDVMESGLLELDTSGVDAEAINTIFRAAHSIKGGSATFGFVAVAEFTHKMETILDEMRDGRRAVTEGTVNLLLESVDCLREMLTAVRAKETLDEERIAALAGQMEALLTGGGEAGAAAPAAASGEPAPDPREAIIGWTIRFRPLPHLMRTGNDPVRMFRELRSLGELEVASDLSRLPALADLEPEEAYAAWTLTLKGAIPREQVDEVFEWVDGDCELEIAPIGGAVPAPAPASVAVPPVAEERPQQVEVPATVAARAHPAASPVASPATGPSVAAPAAARKGGAKKPLTPETGSIRVSIDKIDALINFVGELVITQSMLGQMGAEFQMSRLEQLRDGLAQLERNTRELQESVMSIRMLPISFSFSRFPRMVHDLCQKLSKEVELKISGEQTELDKTVMEKIGDPLVHLVRNSLDHGIESPAERLAAGKPEVGTVHLNAYHKGGSIVIEITDDGKGIDPEAILAKARERGLVGAEENLPLERVYDLLFQPGFSTAQVVSDVSGRGVGMDVVKRNIKDLGGTVEVRSAVGKGSTFTIRLPLTLAILDGQLVRVGRETYIIPLVSIIETLQTRAEQINAIAGQAELYKLRDDYIPIVRLYDVFGIVPDSTNLRDGLLVVVEGDGQKVGLFVDDLLSQQQVVIKSLESNFRKVEGISGATILGDGTVALILDISGLISLSDRVSGESQAA
ncbi:chemotaxis protein CheA [Endothiovibrio diazotrophicus]